MTVGRLFFIVAFSLFIIGTAMLLPNGLNQERRADPEYRTEKVGLKLEQYFGKEAVSSGIRKINDDQYDQKKIVYWFSSYNDVTFQREFKELSKDGGGIIYNTKSVSQKLPAPPKRWYGLESMILKNGELEVEFRKIMISSPLEALSVLILLLTPVFALAIASIIVSLSNSRKAHPTIKI